jgi:hypothetical protein
VGSRAGRDDVEKRKILTLPGLEIRPIDCPARSQSPLYRLLSEGNIYKIIFGKTQDKRQFGRLRYRWEDEIKTDIRGTGIVYESVD